MNAGFLEKLLHPIQASRLPIFGARTCRNASIIQSRQIGQATKRRIVGIKRRAGYRLHCILQYLAIMGRSWFLLPSSWVNASPHNPTWTLDVRQRMTIPIWSHLSLSWDHLYTSETTPSNLLSAPLLVFEQTKRDFSDIMKSNEMWSRIHHTFSSSFSRFLFAFIFEWASNILFTVEMPRGDIIKQIWLYSSL